MNANPGGEKDSYDRGGTLPTSASWVIDWLHLFMDLQDGLSINRSGHACGSREPP